MLLSVANLVFFLPPAYLWAGGGPHWLSLRGFGDAGPRELRSGTYQGQLYCYSNVALCLPSSAANRHLLCIPCPAQVLRCKDHRSGGDVALKIIRNKKRFQKQAAVEAAILALLREQVV